MILDGYEGGFYHSREVLMAHLQSASLQREAPGSIVLEEGVSSKTAWFVVAPLYPKVPS